MKYKIKENIKSNYINKDCLIIGIYQKKKIKTYNNIYINIKKEIKKYNFLGKINTHLLIKNTNSSNIEDIILLGYGLKKKINLNKFNKIIKYLFKVIKKTNYKNIIYNINNFNFKNLNWRIEKIIKIFEKKKYKFNKYKKKKKKNKSFTINFIINKIENKKKILFSIKKSLIISNGIKKSKDLSNTPPNICNSLYIYKKIKKKIKSKYIHIYSLNKKNMLDLKMNAYLSVNKGSSNEPLMTIINYKKCKNKKPIILVGKGITFDSGGISIKKSKNMYEMKYDMSGASSIYGLMYIISKLKLKINVIGILACAENMIDKNSTRPGDIIKTLSKKTIEIINTDAEGRLILCDVFTYIKKFNPDIVIDISTLTGSCLISLGNKISGLISNNKNLTKDLIEASKKTQDYLWELPLFKKYNKYLKSNFADIKNCSEIPYAGTITAACFLSKFTKSYKWAHIDIAGTAYNKKGSTGRPIELITQFLIKKSK